MAKVISLLTGKGGAGKSTISFNLAGSLAEKNKKVILIDADNEKPDAYGMYKQAEDKKPRFDIVLADHDNLREQVRELSGDYEYIIFDTPPNYTVSSLRSCMVSDLAIVIASPSFSDENAVPKSVNIANDAAKPVYILMNKIMRNQKLSQNLFNEMGDSDYKVLGTYITDKVAIRECAYFGEYVGTYEPNCASHKEFQDLSKEIVNLF